MKVTCDKCKSEMVLREGKYGKFYGCSNFPKCRNIKKVKDVVESNPNRLTLTKGTFVELETYFSEEDIMRIKTVFVNEDDLVEAFYGGTWLQDGYFIYQGKYVVRCTRSKYRRINFETNIWYTNSSTFWERVKYYYLCVCKLEDLEALKENKDCLGAKQTLLFYKQYCPFKQRYSLTQVLEGKIKSNRFYYFDEDENKECYKRLTAKSIVQVVKLA